MSVFNNRGILLNRIWKDGSFWPWHLTVLVLSQNAPTLPGCKYLLFLIFQPHRLTSHLRFPFLLINLIFIAENIFRPYLSPQATLQTQNIIKLSLLDFTSCKSIFLLCVFAHLHIWKAAWVLRVRSSIYPYVRSVQPLNQSRPTSVGRFSRIGDHAISILFQDPPSPNDYKYHWFYDSSDQERPCLFAAHAHKPLVRATICYINGVIERIFFWFIYWSLFGSQLKMTTFLVCWKIWAFLKLRLSPCSC